jgi:hypothetical protein
LFGLTNKKKKELFKETIIVINSCITMRNIIQNKKIIDPEGKDIWELGNYLIHDFKKGNKGEKINKSDSKMDSR